MKMNENMKGLHLKVAQILESEELSLWPKFNSFKFLLQLSYLN